MASDKKLIIVPKPGEVLSLLGVSGALADTIKSASADDFKRTNLWSKEVLNEKAMMGVDWGEVHAAGANYTEKTFKSQYQGTWQEPQIHFDEVLPDGTTKSSLISAADIMAARAAMAMDDLHAFPKKLLADDEPEIPGSDLNSGVSWSSADAIAGGITKQSLKDAIKVAVQQAMKPEPLFLSKAILKELMEEEERSVDIAFWYYGNATLVYSIRRVRDNFFYDFANKTFKLLPLSPRAGMPRAAPINSSGYVYSTRLSGKLDDGEYVVTFRDSKADYVVIGIMALFMKDGTQQSTPSQGLEDTPIEEGIPSPQGVYRRAERPVRSVDTGGTEGSEQPVTSGQG